MFRSTRRKPIQMRVRGINFDWDNLETNLISFVSKTQTFVTPGKEYEVHAVSVYKKVVFLLLVDDINTPIFIPAPLFEIISSEIPSDWKCNLIGRLDLELIMGPDFLSKDLDAYIGIVDQDAELLTKLWNRIYQA
jgi:hypothetical protein